MMTAPKRVCSQEQALTRGRHLQDVEVRWWMRRRSNLGHDIMVKLINNDEDGYRHLQSWYENTHIRGNATS